MYAIKAPIPLMMAQQIQMRFSQSHAWSTLCWLLESFAPMTATADMRPASTVLIPAIWV